jgi:hypothetical protein
MAQSLRRGPILTDLEREISAELEKNNEPNRVYGTSAEVVAPALAMPDYVEHRDGATEIGKLSAEAIAREYEVAAKEIEAIRAELIERAKQCETMIRDTLAVTDEIKEVAARYREQGKRIFVEIESCSELTAEVRKTCNALNDKIAGSVATDRSKRKPK